MAETAPLVPRPAPVCAPPASPLCGTMRAGDARFTLRLSMPISRFVDRHTSSFVKPLVFILLVLLPVLVSESLSATYNIWILPVTGCAFTAAYDGDPVHKPPYDRFALEHCFTPIPGHNATPFATCMHREIRFDVRGLPFQQYFAVQSQEVATTAFTAVMGSAVAGLFLFYILLLRRLFLTRRRLLHLLKYHVYVSVNRSSFYSILVTGIVITVLYSAGKVFIIWLYTGARVTPKCSGVALVNQSVWVVLDTPSSSAVQWAIDVLIMFGAFLGSLQLIYWRIADFYRDLPLKDLLKKQTPEIMRDMCSLYYVTSRDLDAALRRSGRGGGFCGFFYTEDEIVGVLPDLYERHELVPLGKCDLDSLQNNTPFLLSIK